MKRKKEVEVRPAVISLAGPTCAGKSTVLDTLCEIYPNWVRVQRTVTRELRPGERNRVDCRRVTVAKFWDLVEEGLLQGEHSYCNNWYGVDVRPIYRAVRIQQRTAIGDLGACSLRVKEIFKEDTFLIYIFADAKSLERRLEEGRRQDERSYRKRQGKIEEEKERAEIKRDFLEGLRHVDMLVLNGDDRKLIDVVTEIEDGLRKWEERRRALITDFDVPRK